MYNEIQINHVHLFCVRQVIDLFAYNEVMQVGGRVLKWKITENDLDNNPWKENSSS